MIDVALKFLADRMSEFVKLRTGTDFGAAQMARLVDHEGKWVLPDDRLALTLINIEEENTFKTQTPTSVLQNGQLVMLEPDLKANLTVLLVAHFQQYDVALRYLAIAMTFFQAHRTFTPEAFPSLDERIERLNVELLPLGYEQLNQVWAYVGARQVPSVAYRVRLVVLQDVEPFTIGPPLTSIHVEAHGR